MELSVQLRLVIPVIKVQFIGRDGSIITECEAKPNDQLEITPPAAAEPEQDVQKAVGVRLNVRLGDAKQLALARKIAQLRAQGLSNPAIEKSLGISKYKIHRAARMGRKAGIKVPEGKRGIRPSTVGVSGKRYDVPTEKIAELYSKGLSQAEVGEKLHIPASTVSYRLKQWHKKHPEELREITAPASTASAAK